MLITGLILCCFGATIMYLTTNDDFLSFFAMIFFACGTLLIIEDIRKDYPTAMDVYQGKTTLEITYKDGVAVDSTVVFKQKN